jgi:DNA-binding response OmpR family regulator
LPKEPSAVQASHLPRGTETVLLVEDEEAVRVLVRQILQSCGYTLLEARHGVDALRLAEQYGKPIHLLLTDMVMPHMAGDELAERMRRVRPGLSVLFLSGYTDKRPQVPTSQRVVSDFLHKPFAPEALARRVRDLLDKRPSPAAEPTGDRVPSVPDKDERSRKI